MEKFANLIHELEISNKTNDKVDAIVRYLQVADDRDKVWLIALFTGKRPKRPVKAGLMKQWALELTGLPEWLFLECYSSVGDLGETLSLILPPPDKKLSKSLSTWMTELIALQDQPDEVKKQYVVHAWSGLTTAERLIFNKLIGGGFRIGVSYKLLVNAIARHTGASVSMIMHSIMGQWSPLDSSFDALVEGNTSGEDISKPYPFCLAYPIDKEVETLGAVQEWQAEWKWDGIRGQLIKRAGEVFIWSRGEELVTAQFPELAASGLSLPDGTVLDGEILVIKDGRVCSFNQLQKRLNRKTIARKLLEEAPIGFCTYDILEFKGEDLRPMALSRRRSLLEVLVGSLPDKRIILSPRLACASWEELARERGQARALNSEGLMLKSLASVYHSGRKKGDWWKWKIEPYSIDAVLIYAQKGSGRRSSYYTDYTFAVRDGDALVTIAKAYSGLTDKEIAQVDRFVKNNSVEKFGPVRTVKPELVFEIGFEGIAESKRHKAGVAVRFPRILRWRTDKTVQDVTTIEELRMLLKQ